MEFWDIYDENKKPTGRTMKRNDWCLKDGEVSPDRTWCRRQTGWYIPDHQTCDDQGMGSRLVGSIRGCSPGR